MLALRRIVKSEQIDLVYALSNAALSCANFGLLGLDLSIVTYRGTVGHLSWFDPSLWLTFLNPRVRKILCVSKAVESYLQNLGVSQDKFVTVYKGHDVAWYTAPPTATCSELGVPTDAFVVGCTAVMRAVKMVDILIGGLKEPRGLSKIGYRGHGLRCAGDSNGVRWNAGAV